MKSPDRARSCAGHRPGPWAKTRPSVRGPAAGSPALVRFAHASRPPRPQTDRVGACAVEGLCNIPVRE